MDWFLYDNGLCHERVKLKCSSCHSVRVSSLSEFFAVSVSQKGFHPNSNYSFYANIQFYVKSTLLRTFFYDFAKLMQNNYISQQLSCFCFFMFVKTSHSSGVIKVKRDCNFVKKRLKHGCFLVKFAKLLKAPILQNICERLLLTVF